MKGFYWRLLRRQARLGAVRLFCIAVTLAVSVTFSISLLSDRIEQLFIVQSKEVLAADLLFKSTSPLDENQQKIIANSGLTTARTLTFNTMVSSDNKFVLGRAKGVTDLYPLRGELQVSDKLYGLPEPMGRGPKEGNAWVEDRILVELGQQVGSDITIGNKTFRVTRVIVFEPDRGNNFYSFTPRVLIHLNDVEKTGVIQSGSRVRYAWLFSGDDKKLDLLEDNLEVTTNPNQEFVSVESANETLAKTMQRAYRFLHVTYLLAVLLGAVAVALVSYQYSIEMTYQYAILRCLGLRGRPLGNAIILPFSGFTIVSIVAGLVLGGAVHQVVLNSLGGLIPSELPPPSMNPFVISSLTALIVVASFAWPFLKALIDTPAKILLTPVQGQTRSAGRIAISIFSGLVLLIMLNTKSLLISAILLAGIGAFILVSYVFIHFSINTLVKKSQNQSSRMRLGSRILNANRSMASLQIIAITLTFFSLALIQTLRDDMVSSWQEKIPADAPNFFVVNLFQDDLKTFSEFINERGISSNLVYPIVRGRLVGVNDKPVKETVSKDSAGDRATQRDLSLTFSSDLPKGNDILEGEWHQGAAVNDGEIASVSVESQLAKNLDLKLGDKVQFVIETRTLEAKISSIRELEWESFTPNFYFIFDAKALSSFPKTWLSSFRLESDQRDVISELVKAFPNATFFDVDFLLSRIRGITTQVGFAVESILYFAVMASIVIFMAIEMILYRNRRHTTAVFKAMGATTSAIQGIYRGQFLMIGLLAGLLAYALNVLAGAALSVYILESSPVFNVRTLILCVVFAPVLVLLAGQISVAKTRYVSAKELLMGD